MASRVLPAALETLIDEFGNLPGVGPRTAERYAYAVLRRDPKRADSFLAQCAEITMDLSQEFAGAIAPSDILVNYAWYAQKEELTDFDIRNDFQKFVRPDLWGQFQSG